MKRVCLLAVSLPLLLGASDRGAYPLPSATHYSLAYRLFLNERRVEAEAWVTVTNTTLTPCERVPFLLYRLLDVRRVTDEAGKPLEYSAAVVKDADATSLQVNLVEVQLGEPLDPTASKKVHIEFAGEIHGYREVWAYVRDTVAEEYALLREDTFAYPILALPNAKSRYAERRFTYDLEVSVPAGYTVATGGRRVEERLQGDWSTVRYTSKVPVWRMDIAAARFEVRGNEEREFFVYVLPGHEKGADRVLQAMQDSVDVYTRLFGPAGNFQGYTAIEIPDGWGSQAADLYFLQTAAAFENRESVREVYHEVAHNWNARAEGEVKRCRYFDEAFASYFQALALRELDGEKAYRREMRRIRDGFVRRATRDPLNRETPIVDYGKHEIGGLSYTKGAWSLHVLHELVGDDGFRKIVRRLLAEFRDEPVDFVTLREIAEQVTRTKLDRFFDEWFYGAESSRLLMGEGSVREIAGRYR